MFKFIKRLFSKKSRLHQQLKNEALTTKTVTVAKKQPFYHEMIGQEDGSRLLRIYNRKTSVVVEEKMYPSKQAAMEAALAFLKQYNQGAE